MTKPRGGTEEGNHKELMTRGRGEMLGDAAEEEEERGRKEEEWKEEGRVKVMVWRGE